VNGSFQHEKNEPKAEAEHLLNDNKEFQDWCVCCIFGVCLPQSQPFSF
jgi:hypothetical protein